VVVRGLEFLKNMLWGCVRIKKCFDELFDEHLIEDNMWSLRVLRGKRTLDLGL